MRRVSWPIAPIAAAFPVLCDDGDDNDDDGGVGDYVDGDDGGGDNVDGGDDCV